MSPTPVTFTSPTAPASYSWEATDEEVSARYGVPIEGVVRFDLNTSPAPPDLAARVLAEGRFETPLSEYAPSDYRRLITAAADRYGVGTDEVIVGAGADEILDIVGKVYLPSGAVAVVPTPSYAMYRVITEQRTARVDAIPRLGVADGYAMDVPAVREAARTAAVVWLCSPNNPTALPEPDGAIEALLAGLAKDAATDGREPAIVVLDEAYAEFVDRSLLGLRERYPNLIVVRTASKAYGLAGLRVGFGIARSEVIARLNPFRPPGSVSTVSVTVVTEALLDPTAAAANVARVVEERERLRAALSELGWSVGPSVTNFVLVGLGSTERAAAVAEGLLRHGLVPRTFPAGHPLADHLRLTVRSRDEDDRLIEAARELVAEPSA
jgi:histidinol-phosphate aminotransferase